MAFKLLSALYLNDQYAPVCVRVTRKWECRGLGDDDVVRHVDLVLVDQENSNELEEMTVYMHVVSSLNIVTTLLNLYRGQMLCMLKIPREVLDQFINEVEEGDIYKMKRFRVANARTFYKPVEGRYMIKFTVHTHAAEKSSHHMPKVHVLINCV
ncbi:unnamed protein product [Urochloa humidicola]